ncbi:FGGY family carbohydrate kinase [Oligoflexia bacterium]|nr:FGGY family carbohydrate kinase [Oligoflexia bacterium]
MLKELFLGVDQGGSSTKATLIDAEQQPVHSFSHAVSTSVLDHERIEQDPTELLHSVTTLIDEARAFANENQAQIQALGLACQRSGVMAWDRTTGAVLHPMLSWRDTRTRSIIEALGAKAQDIFDRAILPPSAHYAGGKIALLQKQFADCNVAVGTLDSYLLYALSGTTDSIFCTEDTMAHRTMLYAMDTHGWDGKLCDLFSVQTDRLPPINPSIFQHGHYRDIPITAMLGDQQASLFAGGLPAKRAVLNLGTVGAIFLSTGSEFVKLPGYITSVYYSKMGSAESERDYQYMIEGTTNVCARTVELIKERVGVVEADIEACCCRARDNISSAPAVAFCPLGNTTTPDWIYDLPDVITDWDREDMDEFARALVENLGSFIAENILAFKAASLLSADDTAIPVSGGVARIDYLLQYIADCTGCMLERMSFSEATSIGAALAAIEGAGKENRPKGQGAKQAEKIFMPQASGASARHQAWKRLKAQVVQGQVAGAVVTLR